MNQNKIIVIGGPTASGKTGLAIKLAKEMGAEIINADSLQVYQENPIISAQPTLEEREGIEHHLLGYINGSEEYNIARWLDDVVHLINSSDKKFIIVGGTGFYLKHLIFGISSIPVIPEEIRTKVRTQLNELGIEEFYKILLKKDPLIANNIDKFNGHKLARAYEVFLTTNKSILTWQQEQKKYFPVEKFKLIILTPPREILYNNCNQRFLLMLENGAIEEVKNIIKHNHNPFQGIMKSHGVPELKMYLEEKMSLNQAIEKTQQVVRNYAKRQITWFKHQFNDPTLKKIILEEVHSIDRILEFIKD